MLRRSIIGAPLTVKVEDITGYIWGFILRFMYTGDCELKNAIEAQGRSKRSGWSGHGRTNNRAGNFIFYNFFILFFVRNNNRAGNFSILFLKQRRQSYQNVYSDDSSLGRFRSSHGIASRQSSSFDGWERPPGARFRWPLQRPSMRRRDYHGGSYIHVCSSDWTYRYL